MHIHSLQKGLGVGYRSGQLNFVPRDLIERGVAGWRLHKSVLCVVNATEEVTAWWDTSDCHLDKVWYRENSSHGKL